MVLLFWSPLAMIWESMYFGGPRRSSKIGPRARSDRGLFFFHVHWPRFPGPSVTRTSSRYHRHVLPSLWTSLYWRSLANVTPYERNTNRDVRRIATRLSIEIPTITPDVSFPSFNRVVSSNYKVVIRRKKIYKMAIKTLIDQQLKWRLSICFYTVILTISLNLDKPLRFLQIYYFTFE